MKKKDSVPEWFPFALVASGLVAIAAGVRSGWKPGVKTATTTALPPPVTQAAFP